jgi:muconolactone delta-isomerase
VYLKEKEKKDCFKLKKKKEKRKKKKEKRKKICRHGSTRNKWRTRGNWEHELGH